MRRIRWLTLLAALALVVAACADPEVEAPVTEAPVTEAPDVTEPDGEPEETTPPPEEGVSDDTFRIAVSIDLDTLDPAAQTTTTTENMVEYVVETLTTIDEEGNVQPQLAQDWSVSDDGLTYTFNLVEGAQFHDGEPFNADAVVATLERVTDPEVQVSVRDHLNAIESVEALDEHTVEVTLAEPFPPFLASLSFLASGVVSPASIEGDAYLDLEEPVGTGPYSFTSYTPGDRLVVDRFDDYWGELPHYGTVEFQIVPEAATRVSLIRAPADQGVDMIMLPPVSDLTALEADPEVEVLIAPSNRTIFIAINSEAIDDVRIRQAMNYAVDKEAIIENVLFGAAEAVDAPMHQSLFGHCSVGGYEYDPDRARELLTDAGAEGMALEFIAPTGRYVQDFQVAEAVAGFLTEVGLQISGPETMDFPTYVGTIQEPTETRAADIHLLGWAPSFLDSFQHMVQFQTDQHPPNGLATSFYSNPDVDDLLNQARSEVDEATRQDLYCQAAEIVMEEAPWIFLHAQSFPIAYRAGLENISFRPNEKFYAVYAQPSG